MAELERKNAEQREEIQDLLDEKILKKKIAAALEPKRLTLRPFAKDPALDLQAMTEDYLTYGHRLEQFIARAGDDPRYAGAEGRLVHDVLTALDPLHPRGFLCTPIAPTWRARRAAWRWPTFMSDLS